MEKTKWIFFLFSVLLYLLTVHCADTSYKLHIRDHDVDLLIVQGGYSSARIKTTRETIDVPNQRLKNGRSNQIEINWAPNAARKDQDYTTFVFKIVMKQTSEVVKPVHSGINVGIGEEEAMVVIRRWQYQGDRTGPIALKINWVERKIYIDESRLTGDSEINLHDLVAGAANDFVDVLHFDYF